MVAHLTKYDKTKYLYQGGLTREPAFLLGVTSPVWVLHSRKSLQFPISIAISKLWKLCSHCRTKVTPRIFGFFLPRRRIEMMVVQLYPGLLCVFCHFLAPLFGDWVAIFICKKTQFIYSITCILLFIRVRIPIGFMPEWDIWIIIVVICFWFSWDGKGCDFILIGGVSGCRLRRGRRAMSGQCVFNWAETLLYAVYMHGVCELLL